VLNVGATKSANLWNVAGFASLADLIEERFGLPSVLTGAGALDAALAGKILGLTKIAAPINLVGATSLPQLIRVLAGAKAVVSCDTGPMHLAVALGRPVVALFGPSDPRRTGPFRGQVIQKKLRPCIPCNQRECCDNPVCMLAITPADVMERLEALWSA